MNQKFKLGLIIVFLLVIIVEGIMLYPKIKDYFYREEIDKINSSTISEIKEENIVTKKTQTTETPKKAYLKVPFITQAPLETEANWKLHEESCEEAALLQAYLYETGQTITKQQANEKILDMIDWQKKNLGSHHDIYAKEMKKFIMGYYNLKDSEIKIIFDASIEDIKKQISSGHPVIVPIMGDILKNPYYPYPGYHMLAAIGYTEDRIITNDNGTRRGADFTYDMKIFKTAMDGAGGDILILNLDQTSNKN
mgnify:CR=1 FL=1